jgi:DNA polymerase-3 subunit gamma/tau
MAYKSLYLKYRPQRFEEVAGQQVIVKTLENTLKSGKIGHAYLFAGPRGTGKTTMARLFAKALNCEKGVGNQCCECSNCVAIAEGSHPDVIEIDAASNNGVDQVRDLTEKVKYAPLKGRYKIYIIDEVHMMSTGAFNALLKTLEEPPDNVIFILCTTEPFKIIPTILSRCQRFDFSKIGDADMKAKLLEVLKEENAVYDEVGLKTLISLADGGMRDALSILDQVLAFSNNELHEKDILTLFGLTSTEEKVSLLLALAKGDAKTTIERSENYITGGIDIRRLTSDLIGILKDALVFARTKDASLMDTLDKEQAQRLTKAMPTELIRSYIEAFLKTQSDYKNVNDIRSLFEITLLSLLRTDGAEPVADEEEKPAPAPEKKAVKEPEQKPIELDIMASLNDEPKEETEEEPKAEEAEPAPEPEPAPAPMPEAKPEPEPAPAPEEKPEQEPAPAPAPEPAPAPTPEPEPEPAPQPEEHVEPAQPKIEPSVPPDNPIQALLQEAKQDEAPQEPAAQPEPAPKEPKPAPTPAPEEPKPTPTPAQDKPAQEVDGKEAKKMFEAPPSFLFEEEPKEEKKAPDIDLSKVHRPNIATAGEMFEISDDDLINIMVTALPKQERAALLVKWEALSDLRNDPKLGQLATLLSQGHPYCLTKDVLIIAYDFTNLMKKANVKINQEPLEEMVEAMLGRRVFVYSIDNIIRAGLTRRYWDMLRDNKLPDKKTVVINLPPH